MTDFARDIEQAYRRAVGKMPYSSISVTDLCKEAGITRKLFYCRFAGKDDILRLIFSRDVVEPQAELCQLLSVDKLVAYAPSMERRMFDAVGIQGDFFRSVLASPRGGSDAFLSVARSTFRDFNQMILEALPYGGDEAERDYIASFFADGKAHFMAQWIQDDQAMPAEKAGALYARIVLPFWNEVIARG